MTFSVPIQIDTQTFLFQAWRWDVAFSIRNEVKEITFCKVSADGGHDGHDARFHAVLVPGTYFARTFAFGIFGGTRWTRKGSEYSASTVLSCLIIATCNHFWWGIATVDFCTAVCLTAASWLQTRDLREKFQEVWPASRKTIELFVLTMGAGWCRCQTSSHTGNSFEVFKFKNSSDLQWPTVLLSLVPIQRRWCLLGSMPKVGLAASKAKPKKLLGFFWSIF